MLRIDSRAAALRQLFLDYFKLKHGHMPVKSSPLIPANDPTLMFVNAGMVQFKELFVGAEKRAYKRAVTCQKCMRVSGKHNDLEEVGRTARHHTFFEMLGNFSFGDYFKEEAISMAWQFITREVGLNPNKLWITVFGGGAGVPADEEARKLWRKISGLPDSRILDKGMKENFWQMGDTGPCGPCTEIHYDQAPDGAPAPTDADFDNGRVMEIWNNVFMQFERFADGKMVPLPAPSVDTGMGLERLTSVVQGADSNYHTDLFLPLLEATSAAVGKAYGRSASEDDVSMRVIADHARTTAFLAADGVQPSNEGRGYVMRRIMRRAIRHGKRLGFDDVFMPGICDVVVETMGSAYPELLESRTLIQKVAQLEEEGFRRTLDTGLRILEDEIVKVGAARQLPGAVVFKLYDTYGFPKDLTEVIANERGLQLDEAGFTAQMEQQKERSRGGDVGGPAIAAVYKSLHQRLGDVTFIGYTHEDEDLSQRQGQWRLQDGILQASCSVKALLVDGVEVQKATSGEAEVVLDPTPFYGESGGQVGDQGIITCVHGLKARVLDVTKPVDGLTVARVQILEGSLKVGHDVWAGYDPNVRKQTRAHHSATHLLHAALRRVLGEHVKQAGSSVDAEHLRFDFAHFEALTSEQLNAAENDVNERIERRLNVQTEVLPFDTAKQKGAMALFGEKYGDVVRVITMGDSVEFCGGTHARNTGDLGMLLVTREESVASGVRRIEAEVGQAAVRTVERMAQGLVALIQQLANKDAAIDETLFYSNAPALKIAQRAAKSYTEQVAQLKAQGIEPVGVQLTAKIPSALALRDVATARQVRDVWLGIGQLANARSNEIVALRDRLVATTRDPWHVINDFAALLLAVRENDRLLQDSKRVGVGDLAVHLAEKVTKIKDVQLLAARVDGVAPEQLRELADNLRSRLGSAVVCLGTEADGKASLLVAVTKDLTDKISAGSLIKELAPIVGGRGGGRADMAQAGGSNPAGLETAFSKLKEMMG